MASAIDPTKPVDGVAANKADLRANLLAAKTEIEALQNAPGSDADPSQIASTSTTFPLPLGRCTPTPSCRATRSTSITRCQRRPRRPRNG